MNYLLHCNGATGCDKTYPGDMSSCPHCNEPDWTANPAQINPRDYAYDEETYPNAFTARFIHIATDTRWLFEISDRRNDLDALVHFVMQLKACGARGVGYNNVGFDYPVLHFIVTRLVSDPRVIYDHAMKLIKGSKDEKFALQVWDNDRLFEQLDLYKIKHFDNVAKSTSLKALEVAMRMNNIEDLPFPVGKVLTPDEIDTLIAYMDHDVTATIYFYVRCLPEIEFREVLTKKYDRNFMNHNDTKIGKDYFIMKLEENGVECYERTNSGRVPRQTIRPSINLGEVIFPYVKLEHPEFRRIHQHLASKTITETKGSIKDLTCVVQGIKYKFGTGGLHASDDGKIFRSCDEYTIEMRDVISYYPSMAIVNKLFPEHLGEQFPAIYGDMFNQRRSYPKGTPENAMLKLALNGTYGDSNNVYSPFYDPAFTMAITLNGQLLLCMLVEQLIKTPNLRMINVNTDGVGFVYPRKYRGHVDAVCTWWENLTALGLETEEYSLFCQRDCNNYIGVEV